MTFESMVTYSYRIYLETFLFPLANGEMVHRFLIVLTRLWGFAKRQAGNARSTERSCRLLFLKVQRGSSVTVKVAFRLQPGVPGLRLFTTGYVRPAFLVCEDVLAARESIFPARASLGCRRGREGWCAGGLAPCLSGLGPLHTDRGWCMGGQMHKPVISMNHKPVFRRRERYIRILQRSGSQCAYK